MVEDKLKLSERYWDNSGKGDYQISYEDVKEAVSKFKEELEIEIKILRQEGNICLGPDNVQKILDKYNKIFGEFH